MRQPETGKASAPVAVFSSIVALIALVVALIIGLALGGDLNSSTTPLIVSILGLVGSTIPALIAAGFSERASRDIRNGVVTRKAHDGALQALHETGVTDVIEMKQPVLAEILVPTERSTRVEEGEQ